MEIKQLAIADLESITDLDVAFGTTRFLPTEDEIPNEFQQERNIYVRLVLALFYGKELPTGDVTFRHDLDRDPQKTGALLTRLVIAHLRSYEPKHEQKISGVAYLISQLCEIREA